MTDRELLELAAKAAGMDHLLWTPGASPLVPLEHRVGERICWNPLADDGDALRLAVKLNLFTGAEFYHYRSLERFANQDKDEYHATRRAIVRAAAEIARAADAGGK